MKRKSIWLVVVLALSACQDKESKETAAISAPATVAPASAPVAEAVIVKPVASSAVAVTSPVELVVVPKAAASATVSKVSPPAPKAIAPVTVAEVKPATPASKPEVVAEPPAKPETVPVVVKTTAVAEPVAPKVVASAISDADGIALAKKRNCFACHLVDKKVVGPAWKDVAAKYRGDAGAQARIEAKIGKGGSGAWGGMAMPAQPQVTAEERATLARFILNLK